MVSALSARHGGALRISCEITRTLRGMCRAGAIMISPEEVIAVLNAAGIRFILMGNYGMIGWREEPRATQDVDVLVGQRDHRKAVRAVHEAFPRLGVEDFAVVTRFVDPATGKPLIDLMKPNQPLFKVAFRHTVLVEEGYRIPNLEFALACKFAAMVLPHRPVKRKHLDAADFMSMVEANQSAIRPAALKTLGERVYPGGGEEIMRLMEDARAGRRLEF